MTSIASFFSLKAGSYLGERAFAPASRKVSLDQKVLLKNGKKILKYIKVFFPFVLRSKKFSRFGMSKMNMVIMIIIIPCYIFLIYLQFFSPIS